MKAKGRSINSELEVAYMLCYTWISCNVYPTSVPTVQRKIADLYEDYRGIKKYISKSESYWSKCTPFLKSMTELFDVVVSTERRKMCEAAWDVKMTENDHAFYRGQQQNPPVGYCTPKVDKKWEKSMKRKAATEERLGKPTSSANASFEMGSEETLNEICGDVDADGRNDEVDFVAESGEQKKRKFQHTLDAEDDDLPFRYRHPRSGLRSVRPEIYEVIQILESQHHLSHNQASAAIAVVANKIFRREKFGEWKLHSNLAVCDENTMPATSNNRRVEPEMEAMALCSIVEEIMDNSNVGENCVVLSNDGSSASGVGAYVVQSLTVNGIPRNLPILGVCTESREILAELGRCWLLQRITSIPQQTY